MIGPRDLWPEAVWREKLAPPRALVEFDGGLYAPPRRPQTAAHLAWITDPPRALSYAVERARREGASRLALGGPPGNYLLSGVSPESADLFASQGFQCVGGHLDLRVDPRAPAGTDPRVRRCEDDEALIEWVGIRFGCAWSEECARASRDGALLEAELDERRVGFVAVGGNNAALGSFGPIGVIPEARGSGIGAALCSAAMQTLARQGFVSVTVPWVAAETVAFYGRTVKVLGSQRRLALSLPLRTDSA